MGATFKRGQHPTIGWTDPPAPPSPVQRAAGVAVGAATMVAGAVIAPLPGPFGVPVMAMGAGMILKNFNTAKRWFVKEQRKRPRLLTPVRRMLKDPKGEAERAYATARMRMPGLRRKAEPAA